MSLETYEESHLLGTIEKKGFSADIIGWQHGFHPIP
jgi:hypothetical protein